MWRAWRPLLHRWRRSRLTDPRFAFLFTPPPDDDLIAIDCETSSLNVAEAQLLAVAAVRVRGNRIVASECFYELVRPEGYMPADSVTIHQLRPVDVVAARPATEVLVELLDFIGSRPLLGYYLEYDLAILNKYLAPLMGCRLPNRQIEVSALYYDRYFSIHQPEQDLRLRSMLQRLKLPELPAHNPLNDAMSAAMIYLQLQQGAKSL